MAGEHVDVPLIGEVALEISNRTVQLLHVYTGRGPTRARTHISGDFVTIVLEALLTKGERSLIRDGERPRVLDKRKAYQRGMGPDLIAQVEQATGREVRAFLSDHHIDPDLAVETFVLHPR